MSPTSVTLMGGFRLLNGDEPARLPLQAQRAVALIALSRSPATRHDIAERLWPFMEPARAQSNLRTAFWRVRKVAPHSLESDRDQVRLATSVRVDYHRLFETGNWPESPPASDRPKETVSLLCQELLPGWDEEWLVVERERSRQLRMRRLETLSRGFLASGDFSAAIEAAYCSIEIEPLRESAHLALIEAHLAEGNRAEAVRQVERLESVMRRELELPPSNLFVRRIAELGLPAVASR